MTNTAKKSKKIFSIFAKIFSVFFVVICAIVIFFNLTHEYHIVSGTSMLPTLNNNSTDGVFVSKIKKYSRGDIIVVDKGEKNDSGEEIFVIKRLIAIAGDKIKIEEYDGYARIFLIYENDTQETILDEPYLNSYENNTFLKANFDNMKNNMGFEVDSLGYITIPENQIFFLGDNRKSSNDCSIYGPKSKDNVVGKVDYIAYGNKHLYWQVIKQFLGV